MIAPVGRVFQGVTREKIPLYSTFVVDNGHPNIFINFLIWFIFTKESTRCMFSEKRVKGKLFLIFVFGDLLRNQ